MIEDDGRLPRDPLAGLSTSVKDTFTQAQENVRPIIEREQQAERPTPETMAMVLHVGVAGGTFMSGGHCRHGYPPPQCPHGGCSGDSLTKGD